MPTEAAAATKTWGLGDLIIGGGGLVGFLGR